MYEGRLYVDRRGAGGCILSGEMEDVSINVGIEIVGNILLYV